MRSDTTAERAAKRRFAILEILHRGSLPYEKIIATLDQKGLLDYDRSANPTVTAKQQRYQFRHDLSALRLMGCTIAFERPTKCYIWRNSPFGLSLNEAQLSTLASLLDTFKNAAILHTADIEALLAHLVTLLPQQQQKALSLRRHAFSIDLHETTDYRTADPLTVQGIEVAIKRGQQVEFCYRTPRDGKERRHVIEPQPMVFERGHVYLHGWSIDWNRELPFRLDYILPGSVRVLPTQALRQRPKQADKQLRYYLSPVIARNSVSVYFPEQVVERHPDGSATVTAQVTDLFEARRILLSYGANCTVLEPPALVEEMRTIAAALYKIYHTPGE
jgi:predicted DNA-binding transcriptional regulator YafY